MRIRRGGLLELTPTKSARERLAEKLAEREARKVEGARMLANAIYPDADIELLKIAAEVEEAVEIAQAEHRANAEALWHDAGEAERRAADLRARAAGLEVDSALLERLATERFEAEAAAAGLQRSLEKAILAARSEAELRLIEEARDQRWREAGEFEARCDQLRKQAGDAARLRADAAELLGAAAEFREQAELLRRAADVVPTLAPEFAAKERERRRRLGEQSRRVSAPRRLGSEDLVLIRDPPGVEQVFVPGR
jgi:hypothetical protein